jgi:hypothetical protein
MLPMADSTVLLATCGNLLLWHPNNGIVTMVPRPEKMWYLLLMVALPWRFARAIIVSGDGCIWVYRCRPKVECRYLCQPVCPVRHIVPIRPAIVLCVTGIGRFFELDANSGEMRDVGYLDEKNIPWKYRDRAVKHMVLMPDKTVRCLCRGGAVVSLAAGTYKQTVIGNAPNFRRLLAGGDLVGIWKKTWAIPHGSGVVCENGGICTNSSRKFTISTNPAADPLDVGALASLSDGAIAAFSGHLVHVHKPYTSDSYTAVDPYLNGGGPIFGEEWVVVLPGCRLGTITRNGHLAVWE